MNELLNNQEKDNPVDLDEDQRVLSSATDIIRQCDTKKKSKVFLFILIPILIILILLLLFSTIFAILNINKNTIIQGISIQGIDVSNLTIDQAKEKVSKELNNRLAKEISLKHNDYGATVLPNQFGVNFDVDSSVKEAYSIGRSGNIFENNFTILNTYSKNKELSAKLNYDADALNAVITELNKQLPDKVLEPSFAVEDKTLAITSGKDGSIVNSEEFIKQIINSLANNETGDTITIDIPVSVKTADKINLDEIYKSVHKDASDAYFTKNPFVVYPSKNGLDFKITIDEAKKMLEEPKDEYDIPLKVLYPKVTTSEIGDEAFPNRLSDFSTSFASSNSSRSTNIALATSKINGVVLMPGEEFSYNQTVGKRTTARGFKSAPAYSNGEVVDAIGGGICQVSSTLYNAVLYANLEIVERSNHGFKPTYVKPGLDATVSWGGPDFKFKNNREYPVKIVASSAGRKVYVQIFGLKTDNDYKVVLDAQYLSTIPSQTVYQYTSSLPAGQQKVLSSGGSSGCKTATYKILYNQSGEKVSTSCISRDTYNAHNKVVAVGR